MSRRASASLIATARFAKAARSALTGAWQPKSTMVPAQSNITRSKRSRISIHHTPLIKIGHGLFADRKAGGCAGAAGNHDNAHVARRRIDEHGAVGAGGIGS